MDKYMWYIRKIEFYTALKRKEILSGYNMDEPQGHLC